MSGFTGFGRALLLAAAVAVGLAGCGDNGANSGGNNTGGNNWNNTCGKDGTAGSCKTVVIGGKTWMAENLNVSTADSWCYDNDNSNCNKYGRLYTWEAAKSACQSVGWRRPTSQEWDDLVTAVGSPAGTKLKSKSGWNDYQGKSGNGTDDFGFSALPGGLRYSDGDFLSAGNYGYWWAAAEFNSDYAYGRRMNYYDDAVSVSNYYESYGRSVRCVQD